MSGKVVLHPLTIPEGLTSEQVVQRVRDADFLAGDVKETPREGSLLPETYDFARGFTRQAVLTRMEKQQAKLVDEIWQKRAPDLPIKSPGEMVTLASIVEKETGKADERPRVAGVFVNRLQKHMRLESDPTIVYGLVFGKGTLGHPITQGRAQSADALQHLSHRRPSAGTDLQSGQGGARGGRQSGPKQGSLLRRRRNRRPRFRRDVRPAPEERRPLAADREGRQGQARARRDPQPAPAIHGAVESVDPASFGALVAPASSQTAPAAVVARLAQIGAGRKAMAVALDSLSPTAPGAKSIEELGAVVAGVNDAPAEGDAFAQSDAPDASPDGVASVPLSPAMLADQRAREAKYGTAPVSEVSNVAATSTAGQAAPAAQPPTSSGRPRIYDASEGTRLDPLLNKTYDLSYAKVVPDLH